MSERSSDDAYAKPDAKLAVLGDSHLILLIERLLAPLGVDFLGVKRSSALADHLVKMPELPLLLQYSAGSEELEDEQQAKELLSLRTRDVPVTAILDVDRLDHIGPIFDVPNIDFLVGHEEEELMSALELIGLNEVARERSTDLSTGDLASIRQEIDKLAKSVERLVSDDEKPPRKPGSERTPGESARLLRQLTHQRRMRAEYFPEEMFADPAWDILLDLAAARHEKKRVSVSSLCIAAAVPTTTGLRWIKALTDAGMLQRESDPTDGRRSFISLTPQSANIMERYLDAIS